MTRKQLDHLDQHLKQWRAAHPDAASLRAAYRQRLEGFALNSMALEREPVDPARLHALLNPPLTRPGRQMPSATWPPPPVRSPTRKCPNAGR